MKPTQNNKNLLQAVNLILKDLDKNFIVNVSRRHHEINPECAECKARILEGFLQWYKDTLEWADKNNL